MANKNRTAIILGSEGALGSEIINKLLPMYDFHVVAIDRHAKTNFKKVSYHCADFSRPEQLKTLLNKLTSDLSADNILISAIGKFGSNHEEEDLNFDAIAETIGVNLLGVTQVCMGVSDQCLKQNKKLRMVLVGSAAGAVGSRDIGYGIAKSGLNGLVLSMSKCFAKRSITAIGVNPGIFESEMSSSVSKMRQKAAIGSTHLNRAGTVSEIVNTVLYAALNAPDFLTGSVININGGQYT